MMKRRAVSVSQKVRELVRMFGGKRTTVQVMGAASVSSLKRWMSRECRPIRAHTLLVDDTYQKSARIRKVIKATVRNLSKENRKPFYDFFDDFKNR